MRNKGVALVEVIICIMIISIVFTLGTNLVKYLKNVSENIECKNVLYNIDDMLCFGKKYSYANKIRLYFAINNDEFLLKSEKNKIIKRYKLQNIKVYINNKNKLYINEDGYVEPETIYIETSNKEGYKITIRPGGNLISEAKV